jgi:ribonuclease P protein component
MSHARLGLAIPKKNIKKAVDRNKLKRFVRESFRTNQQNLGGFDVVVLVKRDIPTLRKDALFGKQNNLWTALTREQ